MKLSHKLTLNDSTTQEVRFPLNAEDFDDDALGIHSINVEFPIAVDPNYFFIIKTVIFHNYEWFKQTETLIDGDYQGDTYIVECHKMGFHSMLKSEICFLITKHKQTRDKVMCDAFNGRMFDINTETDYIYPTALIRSTSKACGLDVNLNRRDFTIPVNGVLDFDLPFIKTFELQNTNFVFVMRSRYARLGLELDVVLKRGLPTIRVINNSSEIVAFKAPFFQLVLPGQFPIDEFAKRTGLQYIHNDLPRKVKF
jgi:hypothetical protein